jgi:predicted dehydrogenase
MNHSDPHLALVGLGDAGMHHARALEELKEVCTWDLVIPTGRSIDKYADKVRTFRYGPQNIVGGYDSIIENATNYDAVIIATPDTIHFEQTLAALSVGLNVLVEKPAVRSVGQAVKLDDVARDNNLRVMSGYQIRQHTAHRVARRILERVDKIDSIECSWHWIDPQRTGWRADKETSNSWAIAALGTHLIDAAMNLIGDKIEIENVIVSPISGPETEARISGWIGNTPVMIDTSVVSRERSSIKILGSEIEVNLDGTCGVLERGSLNVIDNRGATSVDYHSGLSLYTKQLSEFLCGIKEGYEADGLYIPNVETLETIDKIKRSTI